MMHFAAKYFEFLLHQPLDIFYLYDMFYKVYNIGDNSMQKVTYGLFFDNHTHIENPDVGKNFDAEVFTDNLKK